MDHSNGHHDHHIDHMDHMGHGSMNDSDMDHSGQHGDMHHGMMVVTCMLLSYFIKVQSHCCAMTSVDLLIFSYSQMSV